MYIQITGRTVCEFTYINTYTQNLYLDTQIHLKYIQFYTHCMNILHAYIHNSKVNENFKIEIYFHVYTFILRYIFTLHIRNKLLRKTKITYISALHTYIHATSYKDSIEDKYIYIYIYIYIYVYIYIYQYI